MKNHFAVRVSAQRFVNIIEWDGISKMAKFVRNATSVEQNPAYAKTGFDRGRSDPNCRLIAGLYRQDGCITTSTPNGSVYLFEKNHEIRTLITEVKSTAGFTFNVKQRLFYFLDYCNNVILEYDWYPSTGFIGKID